eukprot:XP_001704431.1 Hypothetical protein GL50803_9572 [Giardia lamblia ATCC 50803]
MGGTEVGYLLRHRISAGLIIRQEEQKDILGLTIAYTGKPLIE